MLVLPIKKQWFDMILNGTKTEEYREIKPYYTSRFLNLWGDFDYSDEKHEVKFRNGYSLISPEITVLCSLDIRKGRAEWGAKPNKIYYVLLIHEIIDFHY